MAITTLQRDSILELYTAYFNRASDADGLSFWMDSFEFYLSKGISESQALENIATDMTNAPEYQALYPASLSNVALLTQIYRNLLNREPDAKGLAFWANHLDKGSFTPAQAIVQIINGAKNNTTDQGKLDAELISNKNTVSSYFALTLKSNDLTTAATAFENVTYDKSTIETTTTNLGIATALPLNIDSNIDNSIDFSGDGDWFKVSLEAGETYDFDLKGAFSHSGTLQDPYLILYDANSNTITSDDNGGLFDESKIIYSSQTTSDYFLSVIASGDLAGSYNISASQVSNDDFADNIFTLGELSLNSEPVSGIIEESRDKDWFKIDLNAGQNYVIDVKALDTGDPDILGIFDSNGIWTGFYDNDIGLTGYYFGTGDEQLLFTPNETGAYYISVSSISAGQYTVEVSDSEISGGNYPNSVSLGSVITNEIIIEEGKNQDHLYYTELVAGENYVIDVKGLDSDNGTLANPGIWGIYDEQGAWTGFANYFIQGDEQLLFTPNETGRYYISVYDEDSIGGTYTFSISESDKGDLYNDSNRTAGYLDLEFFPSISAELEFIGDNDWFYTELSAEKKYDIEVKGLDSDNGTLTNPTVALYDSQGFPLWITDFDSGIGRDAKLAFQPNETDVYYINVYSDLLDETTGTYILSIAESKDDYANGTFTTGYIDPILSSTVSGSIESIEDEDWFAMELDAGISYIMAAQIGQSGLIYPNHLQQIVIIPTCF